MTTDHRSAALAHGELADGSLASVLELVRSGAAVTRPEIGRVTGLGRHVVTQRVGSLLDSGILDESALGPSTGGRAPRELCLAADAGCVLVAELGATEASALARLREWFRG